MADITIEEHSPETPSKNVDIRTTILVAKNGSEPVGYIAYRIEKDCLPYVYDLVCDEKEKGVLAGLIQRVRKDCKALGYPKVIFTVNKEMPKLMKLIANGVFEIEEIVASCKT